LQQFLQRVEVIGLAASDSALVESIIDVRQQYRLKLPDDDVPIGHAKGVLRFPFREALSTILEGQI
jgi:hypothetical protein